MTTREALCLIAGADFGTVSALLAVVSGVLCERRRGRRAEPAEAEPIYASRFVVREFFSGREGIRENEPK